jgi:hypothetical protein
MALIEKDLKGLKKDDLVVLCKERKLPVSGTKAVLISRLLGLPAPIAGVTTSKAKAKKAQVERAPPSCLKLVGGSFVHARKNAHGNFEDPETHLVFDATTQAVVGKQEGAEVVKLTIEDVRLCRERGLTFAPGVFSGNFSSNTEDIETVIERLLAEGQAPDEEEEDSEVEGTLD